MTGQRKNTLWVRATRPQKLAKPYLFATSSMGILWRRYRRSNSKITSGRCEIAFFALEFPRECLIRMTRRQLLCLGFLILALLRPRVLQSDVPGATIRIDWTKIEGISKTTATLQVVVNPPLRRDSSIHDRAWDALRLLNADFVRFVPWYPYPELGVAELEAPAAGKTSWEFSRIDPLTVDFFQATAGHPVMLNFSTIPQWMFKTKEAVRFPADPNEVAWGYEQGTELRDPSGKEVADYYARLVNWYTRGGFVDEVGQRHESPHHYKIAYWEVLNEPEYEHAFSAENYTKLYDAISTSIRQISPDTKFVGMSLAEPMKSPAFFEYFLDHRHHQPGFPLDMISYHFYAVPATDQTPEIQQYTFFEQADKFLATVGFIESIRQRLSPDTKTDINETGCILPDDIGTAAPGVAAKTIPNSYWNLCGATFAYLYAGLARQGIDIVGSSQLLGYPTQFPSVTMLDWNTGQPNPRYWILKLLTDHFRPQDRLVEAKSDAPYIFAQGFLAPNGTRKLLLVNKRDRPCELSVPGAKAGSFERVDQVTDSNPPVVSILDTDKVHLGGFSVAVLTFPSGS